MIIDSDGQLILKVVGRRANLDEIDTGSALEMASAYIQALQAQGEPVKIYSLRVEEGSVAFKMQSDEVTELRMRGALVQDKINGLEKSDKYVKRLNKTLVEARRKGLGLSVVSGGHHVVDVIPRRETEPIQQYKMLSMRCRLTGLLASYSSEISRGRTKPSVELAHVWDGRVFKLNVSDAQFHELNGFIGRELDVLADAKYRDGHFVSGVLEEYKIVDDVDFWPAWKRWAADNPDYIQEMINERGGHERE